MAGSIAKFYSGRSVFITGGMGFIGKQIVEKLLRSCPEVENVYMLVRQKKGQSVDQRLQQTLQSPVFGPLRKLQPDFHRKIIPIAGDITYDFLGISDADHSRMAPKVSVVIHSAATLNFQEPLRVIVDMNVLGVRRMLSVCKELKKLDALVHISTAYAHVDKGNHDVATIEEKVYDPPLSPREVIDMVREMTDEQLGELTPQLLKTHRRPNTYSFTKAIGEKLIDEEHGNIPTCIVRPTIVAASYAEPFPGWLDNFNAANGVYVGYGLGFIRAVYTKPGSPLDVTPVDLVANAIIASAWRTALLGRKESNNVAVYNLTNECIHDVASLASRMLKNIHRDPYGPLKVRKPWTGLPYATYSWVLFSYWKDVYLPIRFKLMDLALILSGKEANFALECYDLNGDHTSLCVLTHRCRKCHNNEKPEMYEKTNKLQDVLTFFTRNGFKWSNDNVKLLYEMMNENDRKEFDVQMGKINLDLYFKVWWQGVKQYVLKEK